MAQRHTVYLKRSAAGITPEQLLAGIQEVELDEIAEVCGVSENLIEEALGQFRIENIKPPEFVFYRLSYRPSGLRQVDVDRWPNPQDVAAVVAEVLENLDPKHPATARVRIFLQDCVDSVSASYGSTPGEAMAPILGSEVCRWLAEQFDGIIRDPSGDWYELGDWPDLKPLR